MSKFCPKCGEKLVDEAKFCKSCGENVEGFSAQTNANPTSDYTSPPEERHVVLIIIGYVLAFIMPIIGFIIGIFLWTRDSEMAKANGPFVVFISLFVSALIVFMA